MEPRIRVGIVGTGGMAGAHVEQFKKIENVKVAACLDVDPAKVKAFAEKHDIPKIAATIDDLFADVDAVSIVTPDRFHADLTLRTLAAGKHVLCEKPLTVTLEEALTVAAAARTATERGIINMVNFSYRSSAAFQEAIRLAQSGVVGQIRHVHSFYLQQWLAGRGIDSATATREGLWRLSTAMGSGGVLGDLGCHILDLTSASSEDFSRIRCELKTFPKLVDGNYATAVNGLDLDANDTAIIEFELASGGVGVCHTSRWATGHANHLRIGVHGTDGAYSFDLTQDANAIELCLGDERHKNAWTNHWVTKKLEPTPSNWARFITSIRTGVQDQPDLVRGALVQSYLDTCERSAVSGAWETVRDAKSATA